MVIAMQSSAVSRSHSGATEELLIAQHGRLDEAYIEGWLSQFAEALEKPEILSAYQVMREKVNRVGF
jgi:hypothetical protein